MADQIRARRSGSSSIEGGSPVAQVQSIFYDHQFRPGDGRLLTGLGAKVIEYPEILTYIDQNALVIENILDVDLQLEFLIRSNPGILLGGSMERWAGDTYPDMLVENWAEEEQKEKIQADALTFLKRRHVAPLADIRVPEIRKAFEDAKEHYEDMELVMYGRRGCRCIFWLDPESGSDTRTLAAIEKEVVVVEQADAAFRAMCDADMAEGDEENAREAQQNRITQEAQQTDVYRDARPKGIDKVTQWVKERLGKVNQVKLSTWISEKMSSTKSRQ